MVDKTKAFPTGASNIGGMDLRDYFAAKAMQSLLPQFREMFMEGTLGEWEEECLPFLADESYLLADWMLKARSVKQGQVSAEIHKRWLNDE